MESTDENLRNLPLQHQPLFSAILTPHRSLSPKGFLIVMCLIGGISFFAGIFFFSIGAWPIVGFLGLDVLLIYVAFKINYRSGRIYETVEIVDDQLIITRVLPSGKQLSWLFNPYWAKLIVEKGPRETVKLILSSHEERLVFGSFLLDDEKVDFAEALRNALFEYRGGTKI